MAKLLYMRLILRFRTIPLPLGCWRCVDLHGGLIGGDVDVLVLDHDALLAGRPVALQRLELSGLGPQQLHRQTARVVELEAVTGRPDLAQQFHGRPVNPDHLGSQHRLVLVPGAIKATPLFHKGFPIRHAHRQRD
jgi:hypothetical protein